MIPENPLSHHYVYVILGMAPRLWLPRLFRVYSWLSTQETHQTGGFGRPNGILGIETRSVAWKATLPVALLLRSLCLCDLIIRVTAWECMEVTWARDEADIAGGGGGGVES